MLGFVLFVAVLNSSAFFLDLLSHLRGSSSSLSSWLLFFAYLLCSSSLLIFIALLYPSVFFVLLMSLKTTLHRMDFSRTGLQVSVVLAIKKLLTIVGSYKNVLRSHSFSMRTLLLTLETLPKCLSEKRQRQVEIMKWLPSDG